MVLGNSLLKYPNLSFSYFGTLQKSLGAGRAYGRVITRRPHRLTLAKQTDGDAFQKSLAPIKFFENCQKLSKGRLKLNLSNYHYLTIFITFVKPTLAYKYVQIQKQIPYKYKPTLADKYRDGTGLCMGGAENKHH